MGMFAEHLRRPDSDPRTALPAGLRVRAADPGDLERVAALVAERDGGDAAAHLAGLGRELAGIRDGAERALWVADLDGAVVGYARATRFERPADAPAGTAPAGWYLSGVIVDPAFRRRGIGEALTDARLAWLETRTDTVYYFASARNGPTIDLHARLGFRELTRAFSYPGVTFTGGVGILFARPRGFTVRELAPSDSIDALTDLLHAAYKVHADRGLRFVATHQDAETTRRRAAEGECFVAESGGRVVATITWRRGEDDSDCAWYRRPGVAVFGQFAVDPALQGRGIGRALLVHCERRAAAQGFTEMACDTAGPAADMIALYARWGYRPVDRVRWDGVNYESVVLSKLLPGAK